MDSINVEKIQALRKYKQQQFVNNLLLYPLATLTFGLFCASPFWFPSLYSYTKTLICVFIPRILSLFFSAKSLFVLGNLIVIFLLRNSKVRSSDLSCNDNNGDNLVKPNLSKSESKMTKIHTTSPNKSKVIQSSKPLSHAKTEGDPKKLTLPSTKIKKVKMHATFLHASKLTISEEFSKKAFEDSYLTSNIDNTVDYVNAERHRKLTHFEDRIGEEAEEEALLQVNKMSRENGGEAKTNVVEKKRGNMKKERGGLMVPALPTDELKKRADDFIAMVNTQIRLETGDEDVLLDAC